MDKKMWCMLSALLVLTGIAGVNAYAHEGGWGQGKKEVFSGKECGLEKVFFHKASMLMKAQEKLGLTEAQVQAISSLKLETAKSVIHQKADIQALTLDIRSQMHSDKPDLGTIKKMIDQKYEVTKALEKTAAEAYVKLKGILTPTQQAELKKLKKEWKEERCEKCSKHYHGFSKAEEKPVEEPSE